MNVYKDTIFVLDVDLKHLWTAILSIAVFQKSIKNFLTTQIAQTVMPY